MLVSKIRHRNWLRPKFSDSSVFTWFSSFAFTSEPSQDFSSLMSRKPCILVILILENSFLWRQMSQALSLIGWVASLLVYPVYPVYPINAGRIRMGVWCRRSPSSSSRCVGAQLWKLCCKENGRARCPYEKVVGPRWSIEFGKAGQVDFLGIGSGKDAWEAFAKDYKTDMRNSTWTKLQAPHFLIAEIGLTSKTLMKKFQENRTSITLMKDFVNRLDANNISAVKCLVYDGADGGRLTDSDAASKFLNESGILINVPYMSAETVLNKFDKVEKLEETLSKLFSGVAICHV